MTPRELLVAARARVEDPARWTARAGARRSDGVSCHPRDPAATCWCASGAVFAENADETIEGYALVRLDGVAHRLYPAHATTVEGVNDELSHAAVLRVFDYAIAAS